MVGLILDYRHKGYCRDLDTQQHCYNEVQQDVSSDSLPLHLDLKLKVSAPEMVPIIPHCRGKLCALLQ